MAHSNGLHPRFFLDYDSVERRPFRRHRDSLHHLILSDPGFSSLGPPSMPPMNFLDGILK